MENLNVCLKRLLAAVATDEDDEATPSGLDINVFI